MRWKRNGPCKILKTMGKRTCCYSSTRAGSFFVLLGSVCTATNGQFRSMRDFGLLNLKEIVNRMKTFACSVCISSACLPSDCLRLDWQVQYLW